VRKKKLSTDQKIYLAIGVVVLYFLIYWWRLLLAGMVPINSDSLRYYYPSWVTGKEILNQGFYFLWDPFMNMGQPFLAAPSNQALYPIRFLSAFLDYLEYQRIFIVFHVLIAGGFGFLLGVKKNEGWAPPALVGLGFAFNGMILSRVPFGADFAALCWLPAVIYFHRENKSLGLGIVLALQWMGGFPPFSILSLIFLFFISLLSEDRKKMIRCLGIGFAWMMGFAAIQFIPFLEMYFRSDRSVFLPTALVLDNSIHPVDILKTLALPSWFINDFKTSWPAVSHFYLGPIVLLLVILGIKKGGSKVKSTAILGGIFLILAMGRFNGVYPYIPFIKIFRYPGNWCLLFIPCALWLAQRGLISIKKGKYRWVLVGLVAVDLLMFALPLRTPWGDLKFISTSHQRVNGLDTNLYPHRIMHHFSLRYLKSNWDMRRKDLWPILKAYLIPSYGVALGFREVSSHNNLTSKNHNLFLNRLNAAPIDSELFDYADIGILVSSTRNELGAQPPTLDEARVKKNINPKGRGFTLEGSQVKLQIDKPGEALFEVRGPDQLVFSESNFPGWKVYIDGNKTDLLSFENVFLSVQVPEGVHTVRFRYSPWTFWLGLLVTIGTLGLLLIRIKQGKESFKIIHSKF